MLSIVGRHTRPTLKSLHRPGNLSSYSPIFRFIEQFPCSSIPFRGFSKLPEPNKGQKDPQLQKEQKGVQRDTNPKRSPLPPQVAEKPTLVKKRKPTVEEEIRSFKSYELKLGLLLCVGIVLAKILYDAYCNYVQNKLFEEETGETFWKQVGEDVFREGKSVRLIRNRFGKIEMKGPLEMSKRRQERFWGTFEYIENAKLIFLRFRARIWEDIGTVKFSVPIEGENEKGHFHATAYTRDRKWILQRAWVEDDEMLIEIKRRIELDFLLNPDVDFLVNLNQKEELK
eukprot:TRINITY_DN5068_c0_g1_i1.p1 TRINITY_DN5068_c0_g1~~TRINITY_DN5068_c0_g1_i1.p1  ORF type:complete len:284 (+),score=63.03 TRINITY_DN5068_c0_g1_i1:51-902(+)